MAQVNWDLFKCRASAINKMMATKPGEKPISDIGLRKIGEFEEKMKSKPLAPGMALEYAALIQKRDNPPKQELADGCIGYLLEVYAWLRFGIIPVGKESLDMLQMRKGKECEQIAIKLLSSVDGEVYKQHKERIENDYLSGEIDAYCGASVFNANTIVDIKNAFDYPVFLKKVTGGLENGQREQVATYCAITKAKSGYIVNCLVDSPDDIIFEMKGRISRKLGIIDDTTPSFQEEWQKWERSMLFGRIPASQRVNKIPVELFSENEITQIYDRVKQCREWLWNFDENYQKMNL